jgi:hypothetical protein
MTDAGNEMTNPGVTNGSWQLAAFWQEFPRRLSGTGQTETIKNTGNP